MTLHVLFAFQTLSSLIDSIGQPKVNDSNVQILLFLIFIHICQTCKIGYQSKPAWCRMIAHREKGASAITSFRHECELRRSLLLRTSNSPTNSGYLIGDFLLDSVSFKSRAIGISSNVMVLWLKPKPDGCVIGAFLPFNESGCTSGLAHISNVEGKRASSSKPRLFIKTFIKVNAFRLTRINPAAMSSNTDNDTHDDDLHHEEDATMQEGGATPAAAASGPSRTNRRRRGHGGGGLPDMNEVQVNLPAESQPGGAVFR